MSTATDSSLHASMHASDLTPEEKMAVFEFLNRGQAVRAYEVQQHLNNGTLAEFGRGILDEAEAKKKNSAARAKSAIELMADAEREKQAKKDERKAAKEAKRLARLEKEEFERTGGQVKLSKKERKALALEEEA